MTRSLAVVSTLIPLIFLATAQTAMAGEWWIPAAGHVAGQNSTFFTTDVRIVNLASSSATVELTWLRADQDDTAAAPVAVTLNARSSRAFDDIVQTLFNDSAAGAIRVRSDAALAIESSTFTTGAAGCPGTFGESLTALDPAAALKRSIVGGVRLSASTSSGFRTNVGLTNPNATAVTATARLRNGTGASLGTASFSVLPLSHAQIAVASLFNATAVTDDNLFIEIDAPLPLFAYASVVDNRSGDSRYVAATADPGVSAIAVTARQWRFEPATIEATAGVETTLVVRALDVDHGIALSGVGPFTCSSEQAGICVLQPGKDVTVRFTPPSAGTFAFFCTRFCGASTNGESHETMRGTIVVR